MQTAVVLEMFPVSDRNTPCIVLSVSLSGKLVYGNIWTPSDSNDLNLLCV